MDSTTKMLVNEIIERGWYRKGQTFGEGGWGYVYKTLGEVKTYVLFGTTEGDWDNIDTVFAKDDESAIQAFQFLYDLGKFEMWEIQEVVTEYRLVDTSDKSEL